MLFFVQYCEVIRWTEKQINMQQVKNLKSEAMERLNPWLKIPATDDCNWKK